MTAIDQPLISVAISRNSNLTGLVLAALLSANSINVLIYFFVGSSSEVTAALLAVYLVGLFALTFRADVVVNSADYLFALFVFCVLMSLASNGNTALTKEWLIFVTSLSAYPACRFLTVSQLHESRRAFNWTTGAVVALGVIVTAQALVHQWYEMHGKPTIAGYDAASTIFMGSLAFLLISLATDRLTRHRTIILVACACPAVTIFAASLVRGTFVALIATLLIPLTMSRGARRRYIAITVSVVVASVVGGAASRSMHSKVLLSYISADESPVAAAPQSASTVAAPQAPTPAATAPALPRIEEARPPSCSTQVDLNNSISERKALLRDGLYLLPLSGAFGFGLDGFMKHSCMTGFQVHNSILQAVIEFGWVGGSTLTILIAISLWRLFPLARGSIDAQFALCSLAYIVLISLMHGRTSRDIALFALLGLSAAVSHQSEAGAEARSRP
ncbi:hypothetical protein [Bradyrhizobium sp. 62]|uniref:hypothetical protein n=1 Tax=Bradyrhizobium sp. 62 TaxID=1043588 RepID=UPI001FF97484|nr:hypothetical protein [Bradyrhizobium sp. 62]MCK1367612.1 hypothetical protein [Bradyrhizobium sp. 62]